jgi:hypothetical protein
LKKLLQKKKKSPLHKSFVMKKFLINNTMRLIRKLASGFLLIHLLSAPVQLIAQADTTKPKEAEPISLSPSLEFTTVQKSDNSIDLKAALKAKFSGNFVRLYGMKITFKQVTDAGEKDLGFVITDGRGHAVLNYKADSLKAGKDGAVHLKAVFAGNKSMEPADGEVTIKRARLEINPVKEDSVLTVQLKLVDLSTGVEKPIPQTDLNVYVKRSFFPLKIGEGKTDDNGTASVEISNKLPGDAEGNITLMARLDESETYGMLEASSTQKWGVPVSTNININERALWSTHPPLWMLVTFIVLMTAVWGHYIVIIYELFRLRKEEPHDLSKATNV